MQKGVPLLDVAGQNQPLRAELLAAFERVLDGGQYILGPEVEAFEQACAVYLDVPFAIGVSSGSDALLVSLMAMNLGPGDEVITTPFTFFSTAGCIARIGATPVFVDIDPRTFNMDVNQVDAAITSKTKAIIAVHLFGQACDMQPLMQIAESHKLHVIEDAAQAIGTRYRGRRVGGIGHAGCFSFFPSKNLGAFGDGGLVVTHDAALADRIRCMRQHGSRPKYYHSMIGGNFRLDALQAALLRIKLPHLDTWAQGRVDNAKYYNERFSTLDPTLCMTPKVIEDGHVWNQYTLRISKRDALKKHLTEAAIGQEIYYPLPLHLQACFKHLSYREGTLPESELAARSVISIPVFPELGNARRQQVADTVMEFLTRAE